jgi:hypothetical protein
MTGRIGESIRPRTFPFIGSNRMESTTSGDVAGPRYDPGSSRAAENRSEGSFDFLQVPLDTWSSRITGSPN